ncbi:expressed protein [Phakopsora pachyrhizi]|uniref:Expressed protein n=1 Tax=Phakopsora pachyrhizi TaxID=170000 RepID=A0AAV0BL21_PHAPC|nr:expressed protein [Phakopsora pachyrhizi]
MMIDRQLSSDAGLSGVGSGTGGVGLWGSEDGTEPLSESVEGRADSTSMAAVLTGTDEDGQLDDDPTSEILNLPPGDELTGPDIFLPIPLPAKRQPPTFQGAFSQARLQQQHPSSAPAYRQAFNSRSSSLFATPDANPSQISSQPGRSNRHSMVTLSASIHPATPVASTSSSTHRQQMGSAAGSLPPGDRSDSDEFEDAIAQFLDSFIAPQPDDPPTAGSNRQSESQPFRSSHRSEPQVTRAVDSSNRSDEDVEDENDVACGGDRVAADVADGPGMAGRAFDGLRHSLSKPAGQGSDANIQADPPPPLTEACFPSLSEMAASGRPGPLSSLRLPSRVGRLNSDRRPASTPYNSPVGSVPTTPGFSLSVFPPDFSSTRKSSELATGTCLQPPSKRKKPAFKKQNNQSVSSSALSRSLNAAGSASLLKDITQNNGLHQNSAAGPSNLSKEEFERFEKKREGLVEHSGTLEGAIELQKCAMKHVDRLKRIKDSLSEELVRVQIEESVLRHVRGIIAVSRVLPRSTVKVTRLDLRIESCELVGSTYGHGLILDLPSWCTCLRPCYVIIARLGQVSIRPYKMRIRNGTVISHLMLIATDSFLQSLVKGKQRRCKARP